MIKNNKKGFTLVEILATITILALIIVLVATNGLGLFKKAENQINKEQEKIIKEGATVFLLDIKNCDDEIDKLLITSVIEEFDLPEDSKCEDLIKYFEEGEEKSIDIKFIKENGYIDLPNFDKNNQYNNGSIEIKGSIKGEKVEVKVNIKDSNENDSTTNNETKYKLGDVNKDNKLNSKDAKQITQYIADKLAGNDAKIDKKLADVDQNKKIDIEDVVALMQLPDYIDDENTNNTGKKDDTTNKTYGDVNGDGTVDKLDIDCLRKYLAGWEVFIDEQTADVNSDGRINSKDVVLLAQHLNIDYKLNNKLYGDVNSDGKINKLDVETLSKYLAKWNVTIDKETADINSDGKINSTDIIILVQYLNLRVGLNIEGKLYGDVNKDGKVDNSDLEDLKKYVAKYNIIIDLTVADLNIDGKIDSIDVVSLSQYLESEVGKRDNNKLYGDVNKDNILDINDLVKLNQYLAGFETQIDTENADVNLDGIINSKDSVCLAQYLSRSLANQN